MPLSKRSTTLILISVLVLVGFLMLVQTAAAQDVYTGRPPDYVMFLMPIGEPDPNLEPDYYIPRPRLPEPQGNSGRWRVPIDPRVSASLPLPTPAVKSLEVNQRSYVNEYSVALPASGTACLDFDDDNNWGSRSSGYSHWDDQYAGWVPYMIDDGGIYQAENVYFTREESIRVGDLAFKIHSGMPYIAGLASPIIPAPHGVTVTVTAKYYIRNRNIGQDPYDWASLGLKPDAGTADIVLVDGYTRGQWATLTNAVTAGKTGEVMVLLQAQSPRNLDSNIYFDEVTIQVGDRLLEKCRWYEDFYVEPSSSVSPRPSIVVTQTVTATPMSTATTRTLATPTANVRATSTAAASTSTATRTPATPTPSPRPTDQERSIGRPGGPVEW